MSDQAAGVASDATERCAIGISFGNSNSSIAYTSPVSGRPDTIEGNCSQVVSYLFL